MKVFMFQKRVFLLSIVVLCLLVFGSQACIDRIDSSKGLACKTSSDCWDKLPCVDGFCGGRGKEGPIAEPKASEPVKTDKGKEAPKKTEPISEPKAEPKKNKEPLAQGETIKEVIAEVDGGAQGDKSIAPETSTDKIGKQCKGNLDSFGLCKKDSDCCPGQQCKEQQTPMGKLKLCASCKVDTDCPQKTKCCFQTICASRCG